jgi:hypothetical protein
MLITKAQQTLFWRTWAAACAAQGWTKERGLNSAGVDAKRREVLADLGFASLKNVDHRGGFDRVLSRIRKLADVVQGAIDENDAVSGDRRRLHHRMDCLVRCLGLYMPESTVESYIAAIVRGKFGRPGRTNPHWTDLDAEPREGTPLRGQPRIRQSELEELIITLSARLNGRSGFRARAGHSVHDMLCAARLPCACARCAKTAPVPHADALPDVSDAPTEMVTAGVTENEPF